MKKKVLAAILIAVGVLTGCGNTAKDDSASTTTETTQDAEATEEAEPTEEKPTENGDSSAPTEA